MNMRNSRCVFNPATALHRVFIAPMEQPSTKFLRFPTLSPLQQRRTAMFKRTSTAVPEDRLPRDNEIKAWSVQLVNAEGKLDEPRSTASILESIDLKTHMLQTVVAGEPGTPPICKIINKKEAHAAKRAAKKAGKNPGAIVKTVELNWAIDGNDLGHRLNRVKDFLEKGNKVEVVLAGKKKGRKATPEEAEALLKRIKDAVDAVEGSRELKPMEGNLLATATLFYEGKVKKEAAAAPAEQEVVVKEAPLQQETVVEEAPLQQQTL